MQQNINPYYCQNAYPQMPAMGANAVSINIIQPQAFASGQGATQPMQNYYPLYQTNQNPAMPLYPMNYNNMFQQPSAQPYTQQPQQGLNNSANAYGETNLISKTPNEQPAEQPQEAQKTTDDKKKDDEPKKITILTDDYVKSLENYLNDDNPKVRLIGAKEVLERFKEDDSRIAHPSLTPLLNKMLRDSSPSVRFLALTTLQLGYSVGDDETVGILKEIQASNRDKLGEDALLASEVLLKLSAPKVTEVK
ncbi:MAG: HEAT repeat domain-containing protein [Candidatus Gastranaerophilales bacterium]|nr:HEAT repeat domain-containing protein [Candidatus Gastranaerophilales bacterium]